MGGVGKTMLAASLMRLPEMSELFHRLLWVSVGQEPNIMQLQKTLYSKLTGRLAAAVDGLVGGRAVHGALLLDNADGATAWLG